MTEPARCAGFFEGENVNVVPSNTVSPRPKIAVFAYSEVGYVCLEELIENGANVAIVFTHEDDPHENIWFRSVAELAAENDIPVRKDARIGDEAAALLKSLGIELILSFYYRSLIPGKVLAIPRFGSYNMHGALLPKYRGRACVNWAVLNGETETGATLHVMTEQADRGDIVGQESVSIGPDDTAHDVFLKVAEAARIALRRALSALEAGNPTLTPQDERLATTFGRRRPEDGVIDWSKTAREIYNQIRALTHPFPGAFTEVDGRKFFIWHAHLSNRDAEGTEPGETGRILSRAPYTFAASDGAIAAEVWQFEGEAQHTEHFEGAADS